MIIKYWLHVVSIFFLAILCYLVFFNKLGEYTLRPWDESRNAVNAYEMMKSKNVIVVTFGGKPDLWNTKPPLHIWIVSLFYRLFGVNELSLRLPSAISASLIVFILYIFATFYLKSWGIGLVSALILLSSMGFSDWHIARTGDYDALLTLFTFGSTIFSFIYWKEAQNKYLYIAVILWVAAILTKGPAGVFLVPGILLFLIIKKGNPKWQWKRIVLVFLLGILICGGYYLLREKYNPGYLKGVWNNELIGRFIATGGDLERNNDFWYYFSLMRNFRFQIWIYFAVASLLTLFITKNKKLKEFLLWIYLASVIYFLIVSISGTKYFWYDAQLYPLLSLLAAILIMELIKKFPLYLRIFPILIFIFYTQRYIRTNMAYIYRGDLEIENNSCVKYGYFFRENTYELNSFFCSHFSFCNPVDYYLETNEIKRKDIDEIKIGDKVITCDIKTKEQLQKVFDTNLIFEQRPGCWGIGINYKIH